MTDNKKLTAADYERMREAAVRLCDRAALAERAGFPPHSGIDRDLIADLRAALKPTGTDTAQSDAEQVREAAAKMVEDWEGDFDYTDDLAAAIRAMPLPTTGAKP